MMMNDDPKNVRHVYPYVLLVTVVAIIFMSPKHVLIFDISMFDVTFQ